MEATATKPVDQARLARLTAAKINDWLYEEQLDALHDICYELVQAEHPELPEDELWELLPDVFERINPFTAS